MRARAWRHRSFWTVGNTEHKGSAGGSVGRWGQSEHNSRRATLKHLIIILQVEYRLKKVKSLSEELLPGVCTLDQRKKNGGLRSGVRCSRVAVVSLRRALVRYLLSLLYQGLKLQVNLWGLQGNCFACRHQSLFSDSKQSYQRVPAAWGMKITSDTYSIIIYLDMTFCLKTVSLRISDWPCSLTCYCETHDEALWHLLGSL